MKTFELIFEDFKRLAKKSWTSVKNDRDIEQLRTATSILGELLSDDDIDGLIQFDLNDERRKIGITWNY